MKRIFFQQDPILSTETFVLEENRIKILRRGMGLKDEISIRFDDIDPACEKTKRRFKRLFLIPLIFAAVVSGVAWKLAHQTVFPPVLIVAPIMAAMLFMWHAAKGFRPIKVCRFRDKNGKILFELYQPRKSKLQYKEFLAALTEHAKRKNEPTDKQRQP